MRIQIDDLYLVAGHHAAQAWLPPDAPASMPASQIAVCTETQIAVCAETFGLPMASLETRDLLKHARRLLKNAVV